MPEPLTLLAVRAHPDDEVMGVGGVLARYGDEGVRTVLVTCTDGEMGDGPNGVKPGDPGHDEAAVVSQRRGELAASCAILGVQAVELLGYRDSGMMGWAQNAHPQAFWQAPVAKAAARLAALLERYRPQVVVTDDPHGFYGHPDHIQAHRVTRAALEQWGGSARLYFPALARSTMERALERATAAGIDLQPMITAGWDLDAMEILAPDDRIAAAVDVSGVIERKRRALEAHASQSDSAVFLRMDPRFFALVMSTESFSRGPDGSGRTVPDTDLFWGLR